MERSRLGMKSWKRERASLISLRDSQPLQGDNGRTKISLQVEDSPQPYGPRRLGGPRTGLTLLSQETVRKINEAFDGCYDSPCDTPRLSESVPVVTQFGWQFENRMFQTESGLTGVTEWVLLVGGAEQGLFLPSLTLLAGIRAPSGFEFGVGPNLSLSGAAYAVGVGMNNEIGEISIPVNLAVVLGQDGPRTSLLVGFTVSERRW